MASRIKHNLPAERAEEFEALWNSRATREQIAVAFGFHKTNIRPIHRWASERGLKGAIKPRRAKAPDELETPSQQVESERHKEFLRLWGENVPIPEIAKALGVHRQAVERRMNNAGLERRPVDMRSCSKWTKWEDELVHKYHRAGASAGAMQAVLPHRSAASINKRVFELGLTDKARGTKRRNDIPDLIAPKIMDCLRQHGPSPAWRLRDYARVPNDAVLQRTLKMMQKRGDIAKVEHGVYALAGAA